MTDEAVTPETPAEETPETSAAPATETAQPLASTGEAPASLVDSVEASTETPAETPETPAETPAGEPTWYLSDGVGGDGDAPDWFKADKYKSVADQAAAYTELEKRFGAFVGAPEDGNYAINPPEGAKIEFEQDHPLFQNLNKWAAENQFSQGAYDGLIGMFAEYELSLLPDMDTIKGQLGENADARISDATKWAKANLSQAEYDAFRNAQTASNAADVFRVLEAVIGKTRQVPLPPPGDDVPGATPTGLEEIQALQVALNEDGQRKFVVDAEYRNMVEKKYQDYVKSQNKAA